MLCLLNQFVKRDVGAPRFYQVCDGLVDSCSTSGAMSVMVKLPGNLV